MLLIEYVGHIGLRSLTDGHLGRHLEYFKTLNDARVASVGFIKYNASTTRINKEKNFKIKFQVNLVFYRTTIIGASTQNFAFMLKCGYKNIKITVNVHKFRTLVACQKRPRKNRADTDQTASSIWWYLCVLPVLHRP